MQALHDPHLLAVDRIVSLKEFAKVLKKQGHAASAKEKLEEALQLLDAVASGEDLVQLRAKLLLLLSYVEGTPTFAKEVLVDSRVEKSLRHVACKFLLSYFAERRDVSKILECLEDLSEFLDNEFELLDKGVV